MASPHVLVAGAGIGGLSAALGLALTGVKVDVFERARAFGDVGAGLQLGPNAMHVLRAYGLEDALRAHACEPEAGILRDYKRGNALLTTAMKGAYEHRYGAPYLHIHRADLHAILLKAAKSAGADMHVSSSVTGYQQTEDAITLQTDTREHIGDILIGADGIKSAIQTQMNGDSAVTFTRQTAWRGLIETQALAPNSLPFAANNWMGPGRHFVSYYVRSGSQINFVAVKEAERWADESWSVAGDMSSLRAAFADFDPVVRSILEACDSCHLWGLFERAPLARWRDGRAALLGDAAHPMLPFMAQGAAMAIEDSWVLASFISQERNVRSALKSYEQARKPRAAFIQALSKRNAGLYHLRRPAPMALRAAKFKLASAIPALTYSQLDPVFGVNVTKQFPKAV